jgi:hypothetical protein
MQQTAAQVLGCVSIAIALCICPRYEIVIAIADKPSLLDTTTARCKENQGVLSKGHFRAGPQDQADHKS